MADLDAQLLALAGGDDSSDDEVTVPSNTKRTSPSPQPPSDEQHQNNNNTEESTEDMARKGVARTVKRAKKGKRTVARDRDGSSSPGRDSMHSASMSESESDFSPPPDANDAPIFPYEKMFYSSEDKEEIMSMPEIKREQVLSDRAQQVERHNQDVTLRRLLASREREESRVDKKKRKVEDADIEEGQRKSSRQKTTLGGRKVGESSDAIEAYKRQREQKGKRDELRRRDAAPKKRDRRSSSQDVVSDEAGSEVEWDDHKRRASPPKPKDDPPATLRDLNRARLGRSNFAQVCFYPGFDAAITNCYARVCIGPNHETGLTEYRVCLIKKFAEGRPYALEGSNKRSFVTTQYAVVAHGKAEKEFPFIACSDSPFTEAEFNRYRKTMIVEDCKMATKSAVDAKIADINRLINHRFTKDELNEKLRKQGAYDNKGAVFQRIQIERRRQEAIAAGDESAIAKCDAEMAEFTGPKLAFGTMLVKPRSTEKTEQERLLEVNLRNQKLNAENVRRAQLDERRAAQKAAAAVARGEAVADPFARVKTRAKTHYDVNRTVPKGPTPATEGNDSSRAGTPDTSTNTPAKTGTPKRAGTPNAAKNGTAKRNGGIAVIRHQAFDDENIAALDLDIEIPI
ncbi:hypothetical protein FQN54_002612 [Arachnomyces sp. PD_36]|nr:hypothetical protein FQN54_002612 [Arachnomyces sp. PD_36]